jgi:two-component system cell cycle response regulator
VRSLAGDEVLPRLRTHPETTDIPVVDLSTDAKPSRKAHPLQAGAQAFLTKPIDVNELLDLVNAITAQRTHP